MMSIVNEIKKSVSKLERNFIDEQRYQEFSKASEMFAELEKKGYAKKRGNTLMPLEKEYSQKFKFNTYK